MRWDLFDDEPRAAPARRGRLLLIAATVPWLVVAALLVRTASPTEAPRTPPAAVEPQARGDEAGSADPVDDPDVPDLVHPETSWPEPEAFLYGGRVSAGAGEAAAVALVVAREWLEGVATPLDLEVADAATGSYVEHLAVEAVDFPAPGAAVVALVAILLEVEDGSYADARAARVAVPVTLETGGARPAGDPWWLPSPDLDRTTLTWQTVDDPGLLAEAGAALRAAGYREVDVSSAAITDGWPIEVVADAVAPGGADVATHRVWLREHLDGLVVAGWLPPVDHDDEEPDRTERP